MATFKKTINLNSTSSATTFIVVAATIFTNTVTTTTTTTMPTQNQATPQLLINDSLQVETSKTK